VILTGWKAIAKHLGYGIRTLQRWESHGLPVKRVNNSPRSPVVADSQELEAWILHRMQHPKGAAQQLADNLVLTQKLRREAQEIRKQLRDKLDALRKTLAESRAIRRRQKRDSGGVR
jgi:hypothetical protein